MKLYKIKSGTKMYDNHTIMKPVGVINIEGYYAIIKVNRTDYPNGDYSVWGKLKHNGLWVKLHGRRTIRGIDITHS